jgi:hypothetical protein
MMSVINESQAGDTLVCLEEFTGPPQGVRRSAESNRTFCIGERVRYVSFYRDENLKDNPVCWMVVFDAADGKRYAATQTYFVTEECWEGLKAHFGQKEPQLAKG